MIHRYAKQIVGAVSAAGYSETASLVKHGPFKIPNTFEARAALGPVQDRIRGQSIAIIGLGGTGSYVLDLVAKTPVEEIHLLDSDHVDWHTFMRAPGAPTAEEIESRHNGRLLKVDYYHSKYESLREGIYAHAIRVDSKSTFRAFVSAHPIDYAFVCIDQLAEGDSPRQDVVYGALTEVGVPFIDSGVGISVEGRAVRDGLNRWRIGRGAGRSVYRAALRGPAAAVQGAIPPPCRSGSASACDSGRSAPAIRRVEARLAAGS